MRLSELDRHAQRRIVERHVLVQVGLSYIIPEMAVTEECFGSIVHGCLPGQVEISATDVPISAKQPAIGARTLTGDATTRARVDPAIFISEY